MKVGEELDATVIDMRFIKPLDINLLKKIAQSHHTLVTIEDNAIAGGAGSAVNEYILNNGLSVKVLNIGLPDQFIKHGTQEEIHQELGLDYQGIINKVSAFISP